MTPEPVAPGANVISASLPGIYTILIYPALLIWAEVGITRTPQRITLADVQRAPTVVLNP